MNKLQGKNLIPSILFRKTQILTLRNICSGRALNAKMLVIMGPTWDIVRAVI